MKLWAVMEHWDYDSGRIIGYTDDEDLANAINTKGRHGKGGCYTAVLVDDPSPVEELLNYMSNAPSVRLSYEGRKRKKNGRKKQKRT